MARNTRDFDAELQALADKTRKIKEQKTVRLGELVQDVGADALAADALAGALLAAVEQSRKQPEAVARWTERGRAFFQERKRGRKAGAGEAAPGPPGSGGAAPAAGRAAE